MPSREDDDRLNRIPVDSELRKVALEFADLQLELPTEGIYDEPVRYYKANKHWATIIEGHVRWLASLAAWHEAENERYAGIQAILVFLQGVEMVTPAEMQEAITEGIYKAVNDVAKQIVSGSRANFAVDENGNLIPPGVGGQAPIEDDPLTPVNETKAAAAGCAITQALGIDEFISDIDTLYGNVNGTPVTSEVDALEQLSWKYLVSDALAAGLTQYYTYRMTEAGLPSLNTDNLAEHLYCRNSGNTIQDVRGFFAASTSITLLQKDAFIGLTDGLSQEQYDAWCALGSKAPSTKYYDYGCEPIATETKIIAWDSSVNAVNGTQKIDHRYQVETEGVLTDPDGDIQDTWYYVPSGGNPVFSLARFNILSSGAGTDPTVNQVPYRADHKYTWTYDRTTTSVLTELQAVKDAGMAAGSTGELTVKITDLGLYQ